MEGLAHEIPEQGLSPRARGNRVVAVVDEARRGSIPACAGEPWKVWLTRYPNRVYPRVRGGTHEAQLPALREAGLSPRARGNPPPCVCRL